MTACTILTADRIFDGDMFHEETALVLAEGRIVALTALGDLPSGASVTHTGAAVLCPGFVDWQVNGGGGVLFNETPTADGAAAMARAHLAFGTTALLPTIITDHEAVTEAAAEAISNALRTGHPGIVGIHFEGPHLSVEKCGVHDPGLFRPLCPADMRRYTRRDLGKVVVTLAPENASHADIETLAAHDVIVSLGHTNADYETAHAAFRAGASAVTHVFNAMASLHHRKPGLIGAAMERADIWCGLIADGHHVHAAVLKMLMAAGPVDRMTLVTDAMSTVGVSADTFSLNGRTVTRANGRLTVAGGTLAGSDLDMMSAVRFTVHHCGQPLERALQMASRNPARMLGLTDRGRFAPGARADILALDSALNLTGIWLGGEPVAP
ncbi:N-acetylglucosamine-6-phosphate deacetylase [Roseibium aquae]|uniref:N-acetylglucosamine-6-phosphate deacetylase n=1 Tax=Roseibium aquae TaxID=1323746 RepID=A0A916TAM6_9HYPH|nr:N-acetylglucosamine-6-phosphate deacetylase [Roseibium aquae]GGB38129.1 N-acetylglucosamine-6-phosphate deacetylase [Roseibium aquae]